MTEYEKAMLKLKALEITQRQAIVAMVSMGVGSDAALKIGIESRSAVDKATVWISSLLERTP